MIIGEEEYVRPLLGHFPDVAVGDGGARDIFRQRVIHQPAGFIGLVVSEFLIGAYINTVADIFHGSHLAFARDFMVGPLVAVEFNQPARTEVDFPGGILGAAESLLT